MSVPVYIITLASATHRRAFQEAQAQCLGFSPIWLPAMGVNDFSDEVFLQHAFSWQRPLKKTEVGCFLSHLQVWQRIAQGSGPAVVLEDDVILGEHWYQDIESLAQTSNADYICLETWGKKILGRTQQVGSLQLQQLHLNSAGAAGYMLWPAGAQILLNRYQKRGAALADAFINQVRGWRTWQLVPANLVQMNVAPHFDQAPPIASDSLIAREKTPSPPWPNKKTYVSIKARRLIGELNKAFLRVFFSRFTRKTVGLKALLKLKV